MQKYEKIITENQFVVNYSKENAKKYLLNKKKVVLLQSLFGSKSALISNAS